MFRRFAALAALLALSACVSDTVTLTYRPGPVAVAAPGTVSVGPATDLRQHAPTWLGAIRGGFGNPLKTLNTAAPVSEVVRAAFEDGLAARGMLEAGAGRELRLTVHRFDCNKVGRAEAHADIEVAVWDTAAGEALYAERVVVDRVEGSVITFDAGIFASIEDLRRLANDVLQEAVDRALDDPRFAAALAA